MIEKIFDQESWLFRTLNRILDLVILNILFILTCIPIVTIGTSVCAMYSVLLKVVKNEEAYIFRSYMCAWKENLKMGILLWLLCITSISILLVNIFFVAGRMQRYGGIWIFICGVFMVFLILPLQYLFALQARYENTFSELIKNAFMISVRYLLATIQLAGLKILPVVLTVCVILLAVEKLVWICTAMTLIGFSGIMFLSAFIYRKIFDEIEHQKAKDE